MPEKGRGNVRARLDALSESELRTRLAMLIRLADAVPAMLAYVDRDLIFRFTNAAYSEPYGPPERMCGRPVTSVLPPPLFDQVLPYARRALAGEAVRYEGGSLDGTGRQRSFEAHYIPDFSADGQRVLGFFALIFDSTERVEARNLLLRSELRHRLLVEGNPEAIVVHRDNIILFANQATLRLLGAESTHELIGRNVLDFVAPEDRERVNGMTLYNDTEVENLAFVELEIEAMDGERRAIEAASIHLDWDGQPATQVFVRDMTRRLHQREDQLKAAKLESVGILAGGIAHDFNNLLTGILGNIELAIHGQQDDRRTALRRARKACLRARDLSNQLLTFSKGGLPVKSLLDLRTILPEVVEFALRGTNTEHNIVLDDRFPLVNADRGQLCQVFENLTLNANQAMPSGGILSVRGWHEPSADDRTPNGCVVIEFADNGVGISADDLGKIFDPYFSTKAEGNGLGLSTAYSVLANHGGDITVRSTLGRGTTFTITLPATEQWAGERETTDEEFSVGEGRILVMDDEEAVCEVAEAMLQNLGFSVDRAAEGEGALARYRNAMQQGTPYDAVIMDLTIKGGMGGLEATRRLLELDPHARILVSSGYSSDPAMSHPGEYGFAGVIPKPYQLKDLSRILREVLSPVPEE